jgi:hypothetical protein
MVGWRALGVRPKTARPLMVCRAMAIAVISGINTPGRARQDGPAGPPPRSARPRAAAGVDCQGRRARRNRRVSDRSCRRATSPRGLALTTEKLGERRFEVREVAFLIAPICLDHAPVGEFAKRSYADRLGLDRYIRRQARRIGARRVRRCPHTTSPPPETPAASSHPADHAG